MKQNNNARVIIPPPEVMAERQRIAEEEARIFGARSIRYSAARDAFTLTMLSGISLIIPRARLDELHDLTRHQLGRIVVGVGGESIENAELDLQISVTGLIRALFTLNAAQRAGGKSTSRAKVAAARENGRSGGRPRKVIV